MSQTQKPRTRTWELKGVMQNFSRKDKGSKNCKDPHTVFTILTRVMNPEELDAILFGGVYGMRISLKIEAVIDKPDDKTSKPSTEKSE